MQVEQPLANYSGSPQVEDGHTKIANELLDAIVCHDFTKRQLTILLYIIRKTYGWNKSEDDISRSQIIEDTGLSNPNITTTIQELQSANVLIVSNGKHAKRYKINKYYDQWRIIKRITIIETETIIKPITIIETITKRYQNNNNPLSKQDPQKTLPKDNTKDNIVSPSKKSTRGTRLTSDWIIPQEYLDFCKSERPDLDAEFVAVQFLDYWLSASGSRAIKSDWFATWRIWVRRQEVNKSRFKNKGSVISDTQFDNWLNSGDKNERLK